MKENQSYQEISDFLQNLPKNFNILEEQIDVEVQMAYFERSKTLKSEKISKDAILEIQNDLNSNEISPEAKKDLLIKIANVDDVKSYRLIESFLQETEDAELKAWATLAIQESRMLLESSFLDEQQVFISTGLGGKGDKLRYFIVGFLNSDESFSEIQQTTLKKEFEYTLLKNESHIEKLRFDQKYVLITALIPIKAQIKELLTEAIEECQNLGMDLSEHFMVTNVKELEIDEIEAFLNSQLDKIEGGHISDE